MSKYKVGDYVTVIGREEEDSLNKIPLGTTFRVNEVQVSRFLKSKQWLIRYNDYNSLGAGGARLATKEEILSIRGIPDNKLIYNYQIL